MQKLVRQEGVISLWDLPDVRLYQEQKKLPVAYNFPTSGTPVVTDGIAIVRGAPHEEEAKRFYEFVTTAESLAHAARNYYRIPTRTDIDRKQFPDWMAANHLNHRSGRTIVHLAIATFQGRKIK